MNLSHIRDDYCEGTGKDPDTCDFPEPEYTISNRFILDLRDRDSFGRHRTDTPCRKCMGKGFIYG
jgi:hypothetical protein